MKKETIRKIIIVVIAVVMTFILGVTGCLYSFDKILADRWYQTPTPTNSKIKIIAIDEKTLQVYGDMKTWNRSIPADLVDRLYEQEEYAPSVTVFDIMYISDVDVQNDFRFAKSCEKAGSVITAVNTVYETKVTKQGNSLVVDRNHIEMVEYPYDALKEVSAYGYANTIQDKDGYIRFATTQVEYNGEYIDALAVKAYKMYCEKQGITPVMPTTFEENKFGFTYSGKSGAYEVLSLVDVMEGKIAPQAFANSIVFVGAYAPGMQDAYNVAIQKGAQMYGVEIHANILEAIMEGKTNLPISNTFFGFTGVIVVAIFALVCWKSKIVISTVSLVLMILLNFGIGKLLYNNGKVMNLVILPIMLLLIYSYFLVEGYVTETLRRKKVVSAFKKYVAPQVVDEISKQGDFKIVLGGESREVAVLFVDIRGFTPMSESLEPEQVVEILNEYLQLTTESIFKNGGTLDKFIGDATMAVFNAPFDLDDYIYRAVCTARDIAAGSQQLEEKLLARFGKTVSFGIGVNCGRAVVGNIGCDFRMDYTAIGDTVNTAARLESNAKKGQILISETVYEAVKDRIEVTEIGEIPLKGKSKGVFVYQLDKVH
ncbi:MAG: adenylate/guanylate cyclase domain-containing protein [Lachnospiraceae bacterium]|nr:adenylate/guanylate cyclase domain-containing protein [Lachnospiraceae bacterium]